LVLDVLLALNLILLSFNDVLRVPSGVADQSTVEQILEVKMVLCNNAAFPSPSGAIEVVGKLLINGGIDYNDREFKFRTGEIVTLTALDEMYGYKFAFWQIEEPGFSGAIVTNRTLTVTMNQHQIWWINYAK